MTSGGQAFDIMRERRRLLMRCDAQRLELAVTLDELQVPLRFIDRAVDGINYLRGHPLIVGVALAIMVVIRPRGGLRWLRRGFFLWRTYRAFSSSVTP